VVEKKSLNKSIFITAFVSGFVLMGFEIFGSRILAHNFGSGIYIWGALISVIMAGLSIGYAWGGNLADKRPLVKTLTCFLLSSGLLLLVFPFHYKYICNAVLNMDLSAESSTLIASAILFSPPALALGCISPLLVKLKVKSVETVGKGSGIVYSVATAGSIAGTLVTAFFLIGKLPSSTAIAIFGGLLLVNAVVIWFVGSKV